MGIHGPFLRDRLVYRWNGRTYTAGSQPGLGRVTVPAKVPELRPEVPCSGAELGQELVLIFINIAEG